MTNFVFTDKLAFNRERGRPNVTTTRGQDGAVSIGRTDIALDPAGTHAFNYVQALLNEARDCNIRMDIGRNSPLLVHEFADSSKDTFGI